MARELVREAAGKMTQLCRRIVRVDVIRLRIVGRVVVVRNFFRFIWDRLVARSMGRPATRYRRLPHRRCSSSLLPETAGSSATGLDGPSTSCQGLESESDSDLVPLKISLLGDGQIGKTSFVVHMQLISSINISYFPEIPPEKKNRGIFIFHSYK